MNLNASKGTAGGAAGRPEPARADCETRSAPMPSRPAQAYSQDKRLS